MKLTTLCDNTAVMQARIVAEHGFSVLIDGEERVLFDTGQTDVAVRNADAIGIDMESITKIVLSHGHCDHTGGLREVLRRTGPVEVIAHPDVFQSKWIRYKDGYSFIGIPFVKEELESLGARFTLTREPVKIANDMYTTGEIRRKTDFEQIDSNLLVKKEAGFVQDTLLDDLAMILTRPEGLVIVLGCCHSGLINTIEHAFQVVGKRPLELLLGGTHLGFGTTDKKLLDATLKLLWKYQPRRMGVSHCTGLSACIAFATHLQDAFFQNAAGSVLDC